MTAASAPHARSLDTGELLFCEHDAGDVMYVVRKGRIKIYREWAEGELLLAYMNPGDFFGEMALLEGLPRSASAVAVEPAEVIVITAEKLEGLIRKNSEIAVRMMRSLAGRVRTLDSRMERMLLESHQARALNVLRWLLPQGLLDGSWVRIKDIGSERNVAAQAGIPAAGAQDVIASLVRAGCMKMEGHDLLIAQNAVLNDFEDFLNLKREYGSHGPPHEDDKKSRLQGMTRLMQALQMNADEMEQQQASLVEKYHRYQVLKKRFPKTQGPNS